MPDAAKWETVHTSRAIDGVSWWQEPDAVWVDYILDLHLPRQAAIVDIGAGSSMLVDTLVANGFVNLTAVDLAGPALERIRQRVGDAVNLVVADARDYVSDEPVAVWHDRAVFHFLVDPSDQARYRKNLHASLAADGHAVIATFAPDGPTTCSGFPVHRYHPEELADALHLRLERQQRREHITPWGSMQPFTLVQLGRPAD